MSDYLYLAQLRKLLTDFGDVLFPPSEEEKLLRTVNTLTLKRLYRPGAVQNIQFLCSYSREVVRSAVTENKFHHNKLAARHLGHLLSYWVPDKNESIIFIPIPLGKERLRQRNHNQVETILKSVPTQIHIATNLLERKNETSPQSKLNKVEREKNVKNVFHFIGNSNSFSGYSRVVLVDDVITTGATMKAAQATLAAHIPADVKLICLALAH